MNTYEEELDFDKTKLVIALRTARAITGWSQSEFADRMNLSQSAVARMERGESDISFVLMCRFLKEYAMSGIDIGIMGNESLSVTVHPNAVKLVQEKLNMETLRHDSI
jgi:transcriptional regulator with XRE-family HTH domain